MRSRRILRVAEGAVGEQCISTFRHPLGDPSNPDLNSRVHVALGCIHVRVSSLSILWLDEFYTNI